MRLAARAPQTPEARQMRAKQLNNTWLLFGVVAIIVVSFVRVVTGADDLAATNTIKAAVIATCPILLAGLGGLWSERAGVVNIALEGQMILGTWGAGYFTYWYGPWAGLAGAALLGLVGGLIHAVATVTFGVDHIVSGVAVNIIGLGAAKLLGAAYFENLNSDRGVGGFKQLTGLERPATYTVPGVSDAATSLASKHIFVISDLAAWIAAITTDMTYMTLLVFLLVIVTAFILWRTRFGLRLRSCGENPQAAESLGVAVLTHKYIAVLVSGAFAGLAGGYLVEASRSFVTGQTNGRGFIGFAAMIFGNWRPGGLVIGAGMFGYTDSLPLRSTDTIHALLLLVAIMLAGLAALRFYRRETNRGAVLSV